MLRLRLLGGFSLSDATGEPIRGLAQRRAEAVLALLACAGELGCTRERLAALLWPESDEAHARHSLSNVLHAIRTATAPTVLLVQGEGVRLDFGIVDCDVHRFAVALEEGRREAAIAEYRGPLLAGFHVDDASELDEWIERERSAAFRRCAEALEFLALAAERAGDWGDATRWWGRAVEHDPHNSALVRRWVAALVTVGDRGNAKQAVEAHRRRLRADLELDPDPAFEAEVAAILNAAGRPAAMPLFAPAETPRAADDHPSAPSSSVPPPQLKAADRLRRGAVMRRVWMGVALALGVLVFHLASRTGNDRVRPTAAPGPSLAVLPCAYKGGPDSVTAQLVAALHDELLVQLARVATIRPISRTSVLEYTGAVRPSLPEIAAALGVRRVVECRVVLAGDSITVRVEMTDAVSGKRMWLERFDRTMASVFALTSDIARRIAQSVSGAAADEGERALYVPPTRDEEASHLFLQGHEYWTRPGRERGNFEVAQRLFERAIRKDPTFALARASLSILHGRMYSDRYDPTPERLARQMREADSALILAPQMPEAHVAKGLVYYWGLRDYNKAIDEFRVAREGLPNDMALLMYIGYVHRRLGNWEVVERLREEAAKGDPRNADLYYDLGGHSMYVRHRYADALRLFDRTLELTGGTHLSAAVHRGQVFAAWRGELDSLRRVVAANALDAPVGPHGRVRDFALLLALYERRGDEVLRLTALGRPFIVEGAEQLWPSAMFAAWGYELRADSLSARAAFQHALVVLDSLRLRRPEDWRVRAARGVALAALHRREEALAEVAWMEQSKVFRHDAFFASLVAERRAWILGTLGESTAALRDLPMILEGPSWQSAALLRMDPRWDVLRADARFTAALARAAAKDSATR